MTIEGTKDPDVLIKAGEQAQAKARIEPKQKKPVTTTTKEAPHNQPLRSLIAALQEALKLPTVAAQDAATDRAYEACTRARRPA